MLALLGSLVLHLTPQTQVDAPALATPKTCNRDGVLMRSRIVRMAGHQVMGLRSCLRGFQAMSLAVHSEYNWWIYGDVAVAQGHGRNSDPMDEIRLVRHAIDRGTLVDGATVFVQTIDVLATDRNVEGDHCDDCDAPKETPMMRQTVTICTIPVAGVALCGDIGMECPGNVCGEVTVVRGVLRSGNERITVSTD